MENTNTEPLFPEIEQNIPLPKSAAEALPELSAQEEIVMRASTAKILADLTGKGIEPTPEQREQANGVMHEVLTTNKSPDLTQYPNETLAYLGGLVAAYDGAIVKELTVLKGFVVNKLVEESFHGDAKIRMQALKALGEVDGVDAFRRRIEVTHKVQSLDEVESELLETLMKLKKITNHTMKADAIDVEAKDVDEEYDVDPENPDETHS